jgi:zinc metalloproteinase-like repeat protein
MKETYEKPELIEYGTVEDVTQSGTSNVLDLQESQSADL